MRILRLQTSINMVFAIVNTITYGFVRLPRPWHIVFATVKTTIYGFCKFRGRAGWTRFPMSWCQPHISIRAVSHIRVTY